VDDAFMKRLNDRDSEAMSLWLEILKSRVETGEPYVMFKDNINKDNPLAYRMNNLDVSMTNICTEITLHTDEEHSFICCLSSLNLAKYDEWKNTDVVETAVYFLDGVMEEFIQKTNGKDSMIRSHRHAKKGRALGLGVMGWHTFLQQKNLPFNSIASTAWTHTIFSQIKMQAESASRKLAMEYGEPLWCKNTGMRNTHLLAIAPTVSNSRINACSAGIEPQPANVYVFNGAKGTFIVKNPELEALLEAKGKNQSKYWDQILADNGSVQNLPSSILSDEDKEVYLTFPEINQLALVQQAAARQPGGHHAGADRPAAPAAGVGGHGRRADGPHRSHPRDVDGAAPSGRQHRAGRLRYRILVAGIPDAHAHRPHQDRQVLHHRAA
jgi:ribonucleoside-diphosphate reductase alpha chain